MLKFACPNCNQCFMKWSACQLHLASVHSVAKPHDLKEACKKHGQTLPTLRVTIVDASGDELELQDVRSMAEVKLSIVTHWQISLERKRLAIRSQLCHDGDSLLGYVCGESDSCLVINLLDLPTDYSHEEKQNPPPVLNQSASDWLGDGAGSDNSSGSAETPISNLAGNQLAESLPPGVQLPEVPSGRVELSPGHDDRCSDLATTPAFDGSPLDLDAMVSSHVSTDAVKLQSKLDSLHGSHHRLYGSDHGVSSGRKHDCEHCTSSAASTDDRSGATSTDERNSESSAYMGETIGSRAHPECHPCKWHFRHRGFRSELANGRERPRPCKSEADCGYCHHEDHVQDAAKLGMFRKERGKGLTNKNLKKTKGQQHLGLRPGPPEDGALIDTRFH
eukprot:TRINITY_DN3527_c0_g1_i1.p1 TRINITY_DN3527_c0_g1~~TRINITY_DN3527_c0_g1_i1.p1  ORF type:complete len:391 (-),score=36.91 TRINITY_DN3527_c0_g1_i1:246-1418(-)